MLCCAPIIGALAKRAGGYSVHDSNFFFVDFNSLDEQFEEFSLEIEVGALQSRFDLLGESVQRVRDPRLVVLLTSGPAQALQCLGFVAILEP